MAPADPGEVEFKYGRAFAKYKPGSYWLPHDDDEHERLDILHGLIYNPDKLALPYHMNTMNPAPGEPARILDLGCGTGFWAADMAREFPDAEIIGTDIVDVQAPQHHGNITFKPRCDFNDRHWPFPEDNFDMIHMSMITACLVDWPKMFDKIWQHLRPGEGYVELLELDLRPYASDDSFKPDSVVNQWYNDLVSSAAKCHRPVAFEPSDAHYELEEAGFNDIKHSMFAIPWHFYGGQNDNYRVGGTWQVAMVQGSMGFEAYSLRPFIEDRGMTPEQVKQYCKLVEKESNRRRVKIHSYIHYWSGRKRAIGEPKEERTDGRKGRPTRH